MTGLGPAGLSRRDLEVLTLLTWGHSNQQVADDLGVCLTTATTYIGVAYRRIGVTRRTQAIVWGFRHGLATTDWGTAREPARV